MAGLGVLVGMWEMLTVTSVCNHHAGIQLPQITSATCKHLAAAVSRMWLLGCGAGKEGHPRWVLALLLSVTKHDTLGYLFLSCIPEMGYLKTTDVVLKSCLGEISRLTLVKAYFILLAGTHGEEDWKAAASSTCGTWGSRLRASKLPLPHFLCVF